jgi:hypothetical protein
MLIMKLAVLSCAFYLGITFLADLAFFVVTLSKNGSGMFFTWWGWVYGQARLSRRAVSNKDARLPIHR